MHLNRTYLPYVQRRVAARKFGQLWYEILNFSCNLDPDSLETLINEADNHQYIIAMHPHGVIPFHAILWSAYCDQYLTSGKSGKALVSAMI